MKIIKHSTIRNTSSREFSRLAEIAKNVAKEIEDLIEDLISGDIIVGKAKADEDGVNIKEYYAKIADIPSISTDIYPYTDQEIDEILGVS